MKGNKPHSQLRKEINRKIAYLELVGFKVRYVDGNGELVLVVLDVADSIGEGERVLMADPVRTLQMAQLVVHRLVEEAVEVTIGGRDAVHQRVRQHRHLQVASRQRTIRLPQSFERSKTLLESPTATFYPVCRRKFEKLLPFSATT
jgi:hypothetical protein